MSIKLEHDAESTKWDVSKLELALDKYRSDIIKWLFVFWIAQMTTTFGLIWWFL